MARNRNSNDSNRDGIDDNFDGAPGSNTASRSYSETYDRRGETEYTNKLETANQLQEASLRAELAEALEQNAMLGARNVHFFPSVGNFVIPNENTWAAHVEIVRDKDCMLCFDPNKFVYFDKIIADKLGKRELFDPTHPDYAKYEGLRTNIAVLRNDIIGIYLKDGSFDPGDEQYIPKFASVATALGNALASDTWFKRPFLKSMNLDVANVEGVGAAEMYKHLLEIQDKPIGRPMQPFKDAFNAALHIPDHTWGLPPLEETPFSPAGLSAPPPRRQGNGTGAPQRARAGDEHGRLVSASTGLARTAGKLHSPDALEAPVREASVDEARKILRWLRNLQHTDRDMERWLDEGDLPVQTAKAEAVARLVEIYAGQLKEAAAKYPDILRESIITDAGGASGAASFALAMHSLNALPDGHPGIAHLETLMDAMPPAWEQRITQPTDRLLDMLEMGISRTAGIAVGETTPTDRLVRAGERTARNAYALRSVDTMQPPAREESIELAREILRRLKHMGFADKNLAELIDHAKPEDKAALAEKVGDAVEAYSHLIAEAAQENPAIAQDQAVKDAGNAAGQFAHAIKLMAAKEMPGSIAAAQQISADAAQMPEEWKGMQNHTVDRLLKSMEGGLEKAVGELETQQQQSQEQQEETQQAADTALQDQSHRRRRRRRSSRSGAGGAKQQKQHLDMTADDVILNQGRFREAKKVEGQAAFQGLKAEDLATVKALGGKLKGIGKQAANTTVSATDKIAPDDKGFAARSTDKDTRKKDGPTLGA